MIRKNLIIKGKVQGVGFRFFAQFKASPLSLTGYAKNLSNGDVEIEIQGDETKIEVFIKELKRGNGFCRVDEIYETILPLEKKETRFMAKY